MPFVQGKYPAVHRVLFSQKAGGILKLSYTQLLGVFPDGFLEMIMLVSGSLTHDNL